MGDYSNVKANHFDARIMDDCKEDIMYDEYERYREEKMWEEEMARADYERQLIEDSAYDDVEEYPWEVYPDNYKMTYMEEW